ncbi:MAG TPA: glutathione S-transferase [Ideonella sp.]|nr:glutathione S-transferase [Ideonella sp.]
MYTLFGSAGSGSAAIEVALGVADIPYRIVNAATWEPESALAELKQANPLGQIPTLVLPEGGVLSESAAILIHLGLSHPACGLLPTEPAARAQCIRGLVYIAANCYAAIGVIDYPERWCAQPGDAVSDNVRLGARARLHLYWDTFADQFPARPWLSGAEPGALDYFAAVVSKWSGSRAHLAQARPAFSELLQRIEALPAVAPVFARHWTA